ncbi:hypothetical protein BV20DRAFT_977388 [Pilatotrama ljubarskyi]|nr:hypothetical protein BV20DRAFT_977388 [Pilatotrama ljubarskyi]
MSTPRSTRGSHWQPRGRGGGDPPPPRARPQHRVYQHGKRHMELMPSVSRSSGLDKDGDALRDRKVQEEYREFIQTKVDEYWKKYPLRAVPGSDDPDPESVRHRKETEENLLILFRKLREGLMSAQRRDQFAREGKSLNLASTPRTISPAQTTSTLSHLFPAFYVTASDVQVKPQATASVSKSSPGSPDPAAGSSPGQLPPTTALSSTLIFLLHHLVAAYPSQLSFHTQLRQLHPALKRLLEAPAEALDQPRTLSSDPSILSSPQTADSQPSERNRGVPAMSNVYDWLVELARCLRRRNYARLDALTRRAVFSRFIDITPSSSSSEEATERRPDLGLEAVQVLVDSLVGKARSTTWSVLRTAYREVNLRATPTGASAGDITALWLARSLVLRNSVTSGLIPEEGEDGMYTAVETWLAERSAKGEARRKEGEGMEGRWILVRA